MARSGCSVVLSVVFVVVGLAACDKAADNAVTAGSGAVATGSAPTPAAGAPAPPAPSAPAASAPAVPAASAPTAPAGDGAATAAPATPAENPLKVGAAVDGRWTDGRWYPGKIGAINADGTFRVNYNDGDVSRSLPAAKVRLRHAGAAHSSSGGGNSGGGSCRGGLTQCGGRCVDIHNDNRNCNACGRMCPEACMGGSCVSNHYKYGN